MRKGTGIAGALTLVSVAVTIAVMYGHPKGVPERMQKEMAALDEVLLIQLGSGVEAFNQRFGRDPLHGLELVPHVFQELPKEAFSRSNRVSPVYDGMGGWVYRQGDGFSVNHPRRWVEQGQLLPTPTPGPPPTPLPDVAEALAREAAQGGQGDTWTNPETNEAYEPPAEGYPEGESGGAE